MDCLQTKLKGVVNNNNLPFFNAIKVTVYPDAAPANNSLRINVSSDVRLSIIGSGSFTDAQGNVLEDPKNLTVHPTSGSTQTTVYYTRESEKYIILAYEPSKIIYFASGYPDTGSCAVGIESNDLNQCINTKVINVKCWTYSTINVEDFAVCTKLESLYMGFWSNNSNEHISGSYNKMIEGMIANGRNSGTITGKNAHSNSGATINGHSVAGSALYTLTIISSTEYTAAINDETCRYVKSGDDWVLQE